MRTTITLESDAFAAAQAYAQARALKLGQAVSELILQSTAQKLALVEKNGIWVYDLPADTPQAREANSRLGDLRVSANDKAGAVPYYAAALKDWPRIGWAAETTLKLADALIATDRKTQGCAALSEFTRRYPEAPAALKTRATQTRTRAACPA